MPAKTPEGRIDSLATAVASGLSVRAAAAKLKMSESTGKRLSATAGFDARVSAVRAAVVRQAVGVLASATTKAAVVLVKLLDDDDPDVRFKAARAINADFRDMASHSELSARLAALEARTDAAAPTPWSTSA